MAGLKQPERRSEPIPCGECGAAAWRPLSGVCDECSARLYAVFCKVMGWSA